MKPDKVAVIHDWLNGMRGGEKVLEAILDLFPQADIYTLFLDEKSVSDKIKSRKIFVSSLNGKKWIKKRYRSFLPFFPRAIEDFDLKGYELIISSSHCVAKGVITDPDAVHISYVHSPMRYIWDQYYEYFGKIKGLKRKIISLFASKLRLWDVTSSARVDHFIANSSFIKRRIKKFYRRDAVVINPPIETDYFTIENTEDKKEDYYLTVSAMVPYKRVDLLIKAFNISGEKLIVVGKGPELKHLIKIAKKNIEFIQKIEKEELRLLYRNAKAFVFAGAEDFGMVFVEALACGTPIIAYKKGGVLDIVEENVNGLFYNEQNVNSLLDALKSSKSIDFNKERIRESSLKFSEYEFKRQIKSFIDKCLSEVKIDD